MLEVRDLNSAALANDLGRLLECLPSEDCVGRLAHILVLRACAGVAPYLSRQLIHIGGVLSEAGIELRCKALVCNFYDNRGLTSLFQLGSLQAGT